ncbi:MAG: hypothetical protein NZ518_09630 [Dehalococcoidia bacterium]|nr:hypothetical protein [Dehalococcoidia bacterium]
MSRINSWIQNSRIPELVGDKGRPASVGAIIDDKPTTITITRVNQSTGTLTTIAPQKVRIDTLRQPTESDVGDLIGSGGRQTVLILGYKNHPTVANTDIQMGDTFAFDDALFRVIMVEVSFTDRVLAVAEAYGRI